MSVTPDWTSGLTDEQLQLVAAANSPADAAAGLHNLLVAALYSDPERAGVLLNAGKLLASASADPLALAYATRGGAHLAYVRNHHEEAAALYATAVELFGRQGAGIEVGRTLSSALQTLIYLGRYEEAKDWAKRAEAIFLRHGDALRLARLDSNAGNIDFRLDQPREAIARYERALEGFREFGDAKDVAAALNNLIVSHTSLGQFNEALAYYGQVREHCQVHGLVPLTAQADYNIAYLYMLRGDYARARRLYDTSREHCRAAGDAYHAALCDLDEAEMSLELNLTREGDLLARRAAAGFEQLGMRYEQAKSLVNIAVAASQRGDGPLADSTLKRARSLFVAEGNVVWPAMIDLLRAVLAFHQQRFRTAQRLSTSASDVLATTMIPSRAAHCQIVLARLWLRLGQADRARAIGREAVARLGADSSPSLRFHAGVLEGEINEIQGRWKEAFASYESARREVEDLRGRLDTEDLRISILKDKLAVYESLVAMCLDSRLGAERDGIARALLMVQQAKSRSLADRLLRSGESCGSQGPEAERIESLRLDLNWHYRQIELAALMNRAGRPGSHADELRERAGILEAEMMELQAKSRPGGSEPAPGPLASLAGLQQALPEGAMLLEYFEARGVLQVFLLSRSGLDVVRLGSPVPIRKTLKLLQFQLGRFGDAGSRDATGNHLRNLYDALIRPVEGRLEGYSQLIVAPHRSLHGVPFAALQKREMALMDTFSVSIAPSASVYAGCRRRPPQAYFGSLVMAVPDPGTPQMAEEARIVAGLLPGARLLIGSDATIAAFQREARGVRVLHLAAHGVFRRDNPLFSSLQLADGHLSLFDLAQVSLDAGLVTLSACSSGASLPVGGDELLGLMRGFLATGARCLMASLWEIDDASTKDFMQAFYGALGAGATVAAALRAAMIDVRRRHPHPYHWAPFVVAGDAGLSV